MSTLAAERLKRLLFLVPFVSKHPGRTVDEVAAAVGCSKKELLEELDLVTLIGHPPFQPDDFVDLYVEDDKVYVQFDQRLSAPPRLTAAEGVALATAAALLKPEPGSALAAALQKLERVGSALAVRLLIAVENKSGFLNYCGLSFNLLSAGLFPTCLQPV